MDLTLKYQNMGFLDGISDPHKKNELAVMLEKSFQYMIQKRKFNSDIGYIILPILKNLFLFHNYKDYKVICDALFEWMKEEAREWHRNCPELTEEDFVNLFVEYLLKNYA